MAIQAAPPTTSARLDSRVFASAALLAVMFAAMGVLPIVLDKMVRTPFGLSNEDTSLFYQVGTLASVLLGMVAGLLSDRLGRRVPLIVGGLLVSGLFTALLPHMPSYEYLLLVRFIESAAGTMAITLLMTRGVDLSNPVNRSRTMGVIMVAVPTGYIVGPLLVLLLGGWHLGWLFGALGGAQIVGAIVAAREWRMPESVTRLTPSIAEMVRVVSGLPRTWMPMLFGMVDKFSFAAIALLTPLALVDMAAKGITIAGVSVVMLMFHVGFVISSPIAGRLVAIWGSRPTVIFASILYGFAFILMGSVTSVQMFGLLMMICGGLTAFQFVPNMTLIGDLSGVAHRGTVMAVFNTLGSIAMLVGFAVLGSMSDVSYTSAYRLTGFLEIACGVIGLMAWGISIVWQSSGSEQSRRRARDVSAPAVPVALETGTRPGA